MDWRQPRTFTGSLLRETAAERDERLQRERMEAEARCSAHILCLLRAHRHSVIPSFEEWLFLYPIYTMLMFFADNDHNYVFFYCFIYLFI